MPVNSMWVVVAVMLIFGMGWLGVRLLTRRAAAEYRRDAEKLEEIAGLSIGEAASKALPLLSNVALFRVVESVPERAALRHDLGPELTKVLQRFERIEANGGAGAFVARSAVGPSVLNPGYLRIGMVAAATDMEGEIGVRAGDEIIYELYRHEPPDPVFGTYRSIYHWILAMAEEA